MTVVLVLPRKRSINIEHASSSRRLSGCAVPAVPMKRFTNEMVNLCSKDVPPGRGDGVAAASGEPRERAVSTNHEQGLRCSVLPRALTGGAVLVLVYGGLGDVR